ncbi:MAG TPA: FkbM family methyltransferase [Gemmataceae bacterium]|nr:FkbM family methyltransferase [Gemmataceae bacterium]
MLKRLTVAAFPALPALRAALAAGRWREVPPKAGVIGWGPAARLWYARWCESGRPKPRLAKIRPAGFSHPLYFRPAGSDPAVIEQVFVQREYAAVADLPGVEYIVDCGANIGCTTFFLMKHYPRARAVVVEPDPGNMAVCRRNLAPFRDRVTFVQAGVWSAAGPLVVERGAFRDGAEWSFRVRPARPEEKPDITAVTIPGVLAAANFPRADLLKIDIEGSETEVFGRDSHGWLSRTRNIAIETHGPECERAVADALAAFRFDAGESGELAIYRNLRPADSP